MTDRTRGHLGRGSYSARDSRNPSASGVPGYAPPGRGGRAKPLWKPVDDDLFREEKRGDDRDLKEFSHDGESLRISIPNTRSRGEDPATMPLYDDLPDPQEKRGHGRSPLEAVKV